MDPAELEVAVNVFSALRKFGISTLAGFSLSGPQTPPTNMEVASRCHA